MKENVGCSLCMFFCERVHNFHKILRRVLPQEMLRITGVVVRVPLGFKGLCLIQGLSLWVAPCFLILCSKSKELFKRERPKEKQQIEAVMCKDRNFMVSSREELLLTERAGGAISPPTDRSSKNLPPQVLSNYVWTKWVRFKMIAGHVTLLGSFPQLSRRE